MEKSLAWVGMSVFIFLSISCNSLAIAAEGDPSIIWGPVAGTAHLGTAGGDQQYGLNLRIQVTDPKGIENIDSVSVTAPDSTTIYLLYDDGNHCDEGPGDGYYGHDCGGSDSSPPQLGIYTFTISNKNDPPQFISQTANIFTILDLPTNASPSNGEFVNTADPTFTWGAVSGANYYNLSVAASDGVQNMWDVGNITNTSVIYNVDGNGSDLQEGKIYQWGVAAHDGQGNFSWYHTNTFVFSTTGKPVFSRLEAGTIHLGTADGDQQYGLNLRVQVADAKGIENIESVLVSAPDSTTVYPLYDDGNHCDEGPNDGYYSHECGGSRSSQPQMGTYTFTITNKNDPPQSVSHSVNISTILDLPTNPSPGNGAFVDTATPTFTWGPVNGAISYNLDVRNSDDFQQLWHFNNIAGTSIVYNADGSGAALQTGKIYQWGVGAQDGQGNSSWYHTLNTFVYSTTGEPVLSRLSAGTSHIGTAGGGQEYGLNLRVQVADAQGLENIASVLVTAPDSTTVYPLYDDGNHCDEGPNDGYYSHECGGSESNPPQMGTYTFTITNKNDPPQSITQTANISTILDLPTNPSPSNGAFVDTATPTFTWGPVNGATSYNLDVRNSDDFQQLWYFDNITDTSIVYNADASGSDLQTGKIYQWGVGAQDGQGNSSWYHTLNTFVYSTTGEPVLGRQSAGGRKRVLDGVEQYAVHLTVDIIDPKGLGNIESMTVADAFGHSYVLLDDGQHADNAPNDGTFSIWLDWNSSPYSTGTYTFTAINGDGLSAVATDILEDYPDPATILSPTNGSAIFSQIPTFSWESPEFTNAWISLSNYRDTSVYWSDQNITGSNKIYDGSAFAVGIPYRWSLGVSDGLGNTGQVDNNYFIYYPTRKLVDTWYDRFDDEYINRYKWEYWAKDIVREIRNGQLQLHIGGDSYGVNRMDLRLTESDALDYLQAKVLVENGSLMSSGAIGYARVAGYFYNDSLDGSPEKPYDGYLDDIWVELKIVLDDQGQLKLNSYMERTLDTLGNEGSILLNENWAIPIEFDTFYTLSIQMDWDNAQIIFKCNDATYTYPIITAKYKPYGREYKLRTRLYASGDMKSTMRTRYDDVVIDKGAGPYLYEDFSSPTIDMTKWQDKEDVKEIENGAVRLVVRGLNVSDRTTNQIAPVFRSSYMEAKVSLENGSIMNGTRGIARLSAQFYNDTYGEGSENPVYQGDTGEIFSTVYLQMNPDNTLVAKAYVARASDSEWNEQTTLMDSTFTTPIELDRQYRVSVELKNNQLIFKCENEKIIYPIKTSIYPSRANWLALTSRVYAGTDGLIKARFDDIRLWNREYGLDDIITILNSSAGAKPETLRDIDDFTDDMHIDVTDAISILQYVAGMRNWP